MKTSKSIVTALGLLGCLGFGFAWRDLQHGQLPPVRTLQALIGNVPNPPLSPEQVFKQNYQKIYTSYYKSVKTQDLKYAGMEGLMASLGDPHTVFFPPRDAQAFYEETRANFFGVGAKLGTDPFGAKVSTVFEDGPAFSAGLKKNDVITAVDGKSVVGAEIDSIVSKIKGPEGTTVKLSVLRESVAKPILISIRRAKIIAPTVESNFLAKEGIGYITIASFAEPTTGQFVHELDKQEANHIHGLVIDLRGNPGGLLETAVDMLSLFVKDKVAVKMRFRDGHEEVATTNGGSLRTFNYPIAILINEESASAAEIFSGVLKDYGKVTLVGNHSYGKASVQNLFPMVDNSSAKITIARYYLPSTPFFGRKVDEDGVFVSGGLEPDIKSELDWEKTEPLLGDPNRDSQLARAIQFLQSKPR